MVSNQLSRIIVDMRNFVAKFRKILEICKKFAENQVNERGNVTRCGVVPTFSDLEVVALSITAEAFSIDSENYLFKRLNSECPGAIPNLITRRQYNQRRKKTMLLGESIRQAIAKAIDGGEDVFSIDSKPVKVCQNARASRCQMGRDDIEHAPAWGYCASQNMYYFSSQNRHHYVYKKNHHRPVYDICKFERHLFGCFRIMYYLCTLSGKDPLGRRSVMHELRMKT